LGPETIANFPGTWKFTAAKTKPKPKRKRKPKQNRGENGQLIQADKPQKAFKPHEGLQVA